MKTLTLLSRWLLDVADGEPVAIIEGIPLTKAQVTEKVIAWKSALPLLKGQKWAVYHSDAVEFFSIVLALWQSGCTVCVPGDNCAATVARLKNSVTGFIGEFDNANAWHTSSVGITIEPSSWIEIEPHFPAIEVYTSGSTGEPKPIVKTMVQIDNELDCIETLWPLSKQAVVLSTVTHQHLFGLTFRLFWSFATGRLLLSAHCSFSEDIYHLASQYDQFILLSTPAHLRRLNQQLNWTHIQGKCQAAISSAAPLQYEDSQYAEKSLNTPILEVYGSSETGALAWRQQSKIEADKWTLLPNITLDEEDNSFIVKGPHISTEYQVLSDRIERFSSNTFRLHGRTDRIVKVEGKRLSLAKMENCLQQSDWINEVKALVITKRREEVAVVAELNEDGQTFIKQHSQKHLIDQLKAHLKASFELVLLPRRWRFVSALPYNQQGKLPMTSLKALFDTAEVKWPKELKRISTDESTYRIDFHIPKDLIYFDGHFEGNPILPGITQTHWAQYYGREIFPCNGRFCRLEAVKFQSVIFPDSKVTLTLQYDLDKKKLAFKYESEKGAHSSGRICFE